MFYQPPYLDTMPNGTLCGLLAQSVPEGPDVIHNHNHITPPTTPPPFVLALQKKKKLKNKKKA